MYNKREWLIIHIATEKGHNSTTNKTQPQPRHRIATQGKMAQGMYDHREWLITYRAKGNGHSRRGAAYEKGHNSTTRHNTARHNYIGACMIRGNGSLSIHLRKRDTTGEGAASEKGHTT